MEWNTVADKSKYENMAVQDKVSQTTIYIYVTFEFEDFESEYSRRNDIISAGH